MDIAADLRLQAKISTALLELSAPGFTAGAFFASIGADASKQDRIEMAGSDSLAVATKDDLLNRAVCS
jgi:hypothetical protein